VTNNYLLVFCNMLVNQVYRRASILLLAWLLPWTEQVACHMCACFIVCLLACLQILLTNTKMLHKGHFYKFFLPWLGEGLLTNTGILV